MDVAGHILRASADDVRARPGVQKNKSTGFHSALGPGSAASQPAGERFAALIPSKLHARRLLELRARLAEVEELAVVEAERAGEQRGRKLLDRGVVFLHRVVEEA